MRIVIVLAALWWTGDPELVRLPRGANRFDPPPIYREWFDRTEACSGLRGNFEAIRWYTVPGGLVSGQVALLQRREDLERIILPDRWRDHEMVVRHEILHVLIWRPGHPEVFQRCRLTWETWSP